MSFMKKEETVKNLSLLSVGLMFVLAFHALSAATDDATKATDHPVTMKDNSFDPQEIRIKVGDTVTWTNNGDADHTATSDDGAITTFNTGSVSSQGHSTQGPFKQAGTIKYHCRFHRHMVGTIVVEQ